MVAYSLKILASEENATAFFMMLLISTSFSSLGPFSRPQHSFKESRRRSFSSHFESESFGRVLYFLSLCNSSSSPLYLKIVALFSVYFL